MTDRDKTARNLVPCPSCGGTGLLGHYSDDGSPKECLACGASGIVVARDERGRFVSIGETNDEQP
jgi:DnaJ-class molecular chaperone